MRAARFAWLALTSLVVCAACDEDPRITPLSASWLEWWDSVAPDAPFGVRVYGFMEAESHRYLRIQVTRRGDTVTIEPYSIGAPVRDQAFVYDTLIWVPGITATAPRTVVLRAPSPWPAPEIPWPPRTFGSLTVSPVVPVAPLLRAAGVASGFQDLSGCFFVRPLPGLPMYVAADQSPSWAPEFTGFVYGRVVFLLSTCLNGAPVIEVDSIVQ
jgi:hypothetical protein